MADGTRVADVLEERPDLEAALSTVLAVDEDRETWTFDDVSVDSGAFGELVSRDIVVSEGDAYRLADREAVRRALSAADETTETATPERSETSRSLPTLDTAGLGMLVGALALVAVVRSFVAGSVFRGGDIVLAANDPYAYRYWVEQVLASGQALTDIGSLAQGEPLLIATLARASRLFGGADASGLLIAVYPVAAAVLTAALLYWLALWVTADRRVALAAVVMLAVTPGNALRTALGFADHHAFDYLWLVLTATALVALADIERREQLRSWRPWSAALGLGLGIGLQVLAWNNGPLLFAPVALVLAGRVILDVRASRSSLLANAPILVGLGVGAGVAAVGHLLTGWQSVPVIVTPALLFVLALALVGAGELTRVLGRRARELAVAEGVLGVAAILATWVFVPALAERVLRGLGLIGRTDPIAEVRALFSGDTLGFLLLFGFVLVVALPFLVWATWQATRGARRWLVPVAYGWYFFSLSLFQVRFTGQLAYFTALFAGLGFVWLAETVEVARPPAPFADGRDHAEWVPDRPDASTVGTILVLFLLVGGIGVLQSAVKVEQITTDDAAYDTAAWLDEYANDRGWTTVEESYVLSSWGKNRMYNYFVNGESASYGYARSTYGDFIGVREPATAASMLDDRVRFVVTRSLDAADRTMQARLHDHFGSRAGALAGTGQFRALYATASGTRKAFLFVPGATLTGTGPPNATVTLSTPIEIPGASFTYERQATTDAAGNFSVRLAHPGTYEVHTAEETRTVTVSESAVMAGEQLALAD